MRPINKKGQIGLDVVKSVMVTLLILSVTGIAVLLALTSLDDAGIFTDNSAADNQTEAVIGNVSGAVSDFFGNSSTIFAILVVVVILLAIGIAISVVNRFGKG